MHSSYRSTFRKIGDIPLAMVSPTSFTYLNDDFRRRVATGLARNRPGKVALRFDSLLTAAPSRAGGARTGLVAFAVQTPASGSPRSDSITAQATTCLHSLRNNEWPPGTCRPIAHWCWSAAATSSETGDWCCIPLSA